MATHLVFRLDCHARRAGLARTNPLVVIARSAATKQSSWIAAVGGASLARTNLKPRRLVNAYGSETRPYCGARIFSLRWVTRVLDSALRTAMA